MNPKPNKLREQIYVVISEADTLAGKAFNLGLIFFILLWLLLVTLPL